MSLEAAAAFLERVERDEAFADELAAMRDDQPRVLARVRAEGFDVTEDEVREAFLDRYGAVLTDEQLDQVAAGMDPTTEMAIGVSLGIVATIGVAAAVVAAF